MIAIIKIRKQGEEKMKNADMPAMPMGQADNGGYWLKSDLDGGYSEQCKPAFGLTK